MDRHSYDDVRWTLRRSTAIAEGRRGGRRKCVEAEEVDTTIEDDC